VHPSINANEGDRLILRHEGWNAPTSRLPAGTWLAFTLGVVRRQTVSGTCSVSGMGRQQP
jgi:hypothetical protein